MEVHARWWCYDCQREWLQHSAAGANPWTPEMGCPGCKSSRIEEHIYVPAFPGGDIPRVQDAEPKVRWYSEEITPDRSAAIAMLHGTDARVPYDERDDYEAAPI